jgi:hypothetical protein
MIGSESVPPPPGTGRLAFLNLKKVMPHSIIRL